MKRRESIHFMVMWTVVVFAVVFIPAFGSEQFFSLHKSASDTLNTDFVIAKISQRHENSNDMRSSLYLTHHAYLLKHIADLEVKYLEKTYTISNICFKPHFAIFHQFQGSIPYHFQRLLLEIQRLSPCLLVTPLNCFSDSYQVHAQMSRWNSSTDFLNRRLRNAFIEAQEDNENAPYVKSDYGPELIKKWAEHMFELPSKNSSKFDKEELNERVQLWLTSIKPREEKCVSPSCHEPLDEESYFNICTVIRETVDEDVKRNKFHFENGDEKFMSQLDCVEDRELFIQWMQEKELRKIMRTFSSEDGVADHEDVVNQICEGIYHDVNSSGIAFFNGARSFGSESTPFDTLKAEIALMTPRMIVETMRQADYVNGFESTWTLEKAQDLLKIFQSALQDKVGSFNRMRPSKKISVITRILEEVSKENTSAFEYWPLFFLIVSHIILVFFFAVFVWPEPLLTMVLMFTFRDIATVLLFTPLLKKTELPSVRSALLFSSVVLTVTNLFLTTRVAFCRHRLKRCVQRAKNFLLQSNFSSIGTVDSVRESGDIRQIQYVLAKYTKYQAAQDAYSDEPFEKRSRHLGYLFVLVVVPLISSYWYFVDSGCLELILAIAPSFIIAAFEEFRLKNELVKERKKKQDFQRKYIEEMGKLMSQGAVEKLFAGNEVTTSGGKDLRENFSSSNSDLPQQQKSKKFVVISGSSYDISRMERFNNFVRNFRYHTIGAYFYVIRVRKASFLIWTIALLFILLSSGLLFVPIQRETLQKNVNQDDLFIEFSINNASSNWDMLNKNLDNFEKDINSIKNLQTISNWHEAFERFKQEKSVSDLETYTKWTNNEPISWAVTYPRMNSSKKYPVPSPFLFQFRYSFKTTDGKQLTEETIPKIDILLNKYSENLSPKAFGVLYEHYHRIAVVWNSFAVSELIASGILFVFFSLVIFVFSVSRTVSATLLFSIFVVGTRLEIAAVFSLFSIEHHQYYTNLAVLIGFLAAWSPFCDFVRFRRRILYRLETRTTPEVAPKRRIRVPFIAAVDVVQYFGTLLTGSIISAIAAFLFEQLNAFFFPIVIFIVIQIIALINSIAILLSTKQMFEQEVLNFIHRELRGCKTSAQVCDMTGKLLLSPEDVESIHLDQLPIQPVVPYKFHAPPKKELREVKTDLEEDGEDNGRLEDQNPRPGDLADYMMQQHGDTDDVRLFRERYVPLNARINGVFVDPVLMIMNGLPLDSGFRVPPNQGINVQRAEEQYEQERRDTYSDDEEEEDESMEAEIDEIRRNHALRNSGITANTENPNVPSSSNTVHPHISGLSIPPMIQRAHPRNPLTEPPILEEFIQANDIPGLGPHPRANQYEPGLPRSFVAYCEDPFWTSQRLVEIPDDMPIPPRPFDYEERERELNAPPPFDPNWVPPPGTPPIAALADALAFRARLHQLEQQQQQEDDDSDEPGLAL